MSVAQVSRRAAVHGRARKRLSQCGFEAVGRVLRLTALLSAPLVQWRRRSQAAVIALRAGLRHRVSVPQVFKDEHLHRAFESSWEVDYALCAPVSDCS